jgi:hypothetical protein
VGDLKTIAVSGRSRLPGPYDWKRWILICLVIKGIAFCYFGWQQGQIAEVETAGRFMRMYDDTGDYLDAAELWVSGDGYSRYGLAEFSEAQVLPFAGRMPGLLPVYAPLYYLFGRAVACDILVVLQFLLSTLSVYVLGLIAWELVASRFVFVFTLGVYALSWQVHIYDLAGLMESFSISGMILSLFACQKAVRKEKADLAFWFWFGISALLYVWAISLRPVFGSMLPAWILLIVLGKAGRIKEGIGRAAIFILPLILFLSAWTLRNYRVLGDPVVLEDRWERSWPDDPTYRPAGMAIRKLVVSWGGDMLFWVEGGMGNWFFDRENMAGPGEVFPERIFVERYDADSLKQLRELYRLGTDMGLPEADRKLYSALAVAKADAFRTSYQKQKPVEAFFVNKLRLCNTFLFYRFRPDFPFPVKAQLSGFQFAVKGFFTVFYYVITLLGLLSVILIWVGRRRKEMLLTLFPLSMVFVLSFLLGMIEGRYLAPLFAFWVIFGAIGLGRMWFWVSEKGMVKKDPVAPL